MEDRKKTLRELETKRGETLEVLGKLHESLGKSLIAHLESNGNNFPDLPQSTEELQTAEEPQSEDKPPNEAQTAALPGTQKADPQKIWEEKLRLDLEIAETEGKIKAIEADLARLGDLEGEISRKESEINEKNREIAQANTDLGRFILEDPGFDQFSAPYRQQLDELFNQINAQEKRLNELENAEGNFFARLASGAQGWITKSQLTKNESALKKLYKAAGDQFLLSREKEGSKERDPAAEQTAAGENQDSSYKISDESSWSAGFTSQLQKTEELRKLQNSIKNDVTRLLAERREIANALNKEGNPVRRISGLENLILRSREEIRAVQRRFGSCIGENRWKDSFISLYSEEDKILEEKIVSLEESLKLTEDRIEETKTAIAIDNEKAEIEKMKHSIEEKRQRISEAQTSIAELEEQIAAAEKRIEGLEGK